jgi:hypothetical protein
MGRQPALISGEGEGIKDLDTIKMDERIMATAEEDGE